jgi:hypothetical protein
MTTSFGVLKCTVQYLILPALFIITGQLPELFIFWRCVTGGSKNIKIRVPWRGTQLVCLFKFLFVYKAVLLIQASLHSTRSCVRNSRMSALLHTDGWRPQTLQCSVWRCRKTARRRADNINCYTPTDEGPRPCSDRSDVIARLHAVERTTSIATHRLMKAPCRTVLSPALLRDCTPLSGLHQSIHTNCWRPRSPQCSI